MMEVFVKFNDGQKTSEMELKGAPDGTERNVIFGFFEALGVPKPTPTRNMGGYVQESPGIKPVQEQMEELAHVPVAQKKTIRPGVYTNITSGPPKASELKDDRLDEMIESVLRPSKPRVLPKIGSETRSEFSVEEIAKVKASNSQKGGVEESPEHWVTGIKVGHNGEKRYKCRYWCECGYNSNIYIPLGQEFVSCYECNDDMFVAPATKATDEDGAPERDPMGNFFIANH